MDGNTTTLDPRIKKVCGLWSVRSDEVMMECEGVMGGWEGVRVIV